MKQQKNLSELRDIITIKDVCEVLGIGRNTAYQLLQNDEISSKRIRRKYIIPRQSLEIYIRSINIKSD